MKSFLINTALILFGALLFAASFPNPIINYGFPILAWFAYIPVFYVIRRCKNNIRGLLICILWGALYGYTSYSLLVHWLANFHPLAAMTASLLQLFYMALLFPLLKLALIFYPHKGYILQWMLWLAYEYLRTLGFLGFPYGISGYTQWQFPLIIGIASVFGVWGVSALVLFPSVYIAAIADELLLPKRSPQKNPISFFYRERLAAAAWLGALLAALIFSTMQADYSQESTAKIALIQQNADPWMDNNPRGYKRMLGILSSLSQKALEEVPDTELVVWPETAFLPRIYWHTTYRDNPASYEIVKELLDFLAEQEVPFLIGNDDARREVTAAGTLSRVNYNAAILFEEGEIKDVYRKMHLVPFAEHFPYEKTFPRIYQELVKANVRFWKPGSEALVFSTAKLHFSVPICFEDCFGYISRDFSRRGADFIVNITNDSWADSFSSQLQHLAMSVFRAVENRRAVVRAATSGQTCAIAPSGRILAMAPPFTETALHVEIPLMTGFTPYMFWGDIWGKIFTACAFMVLIAGVFRYILDLTKTGRKL